MEPITKPEVQGNRKQRRSIAKLLRKSTRKTNFTKPKKRKK